jgi:hypothetical protein
MIDDPSRRFSEATHTGAKGDDGATDETDQTPGDAFREAIRAALWFADRAARRRTQRGDPDLLIKP